MQIEKSFVVKVTPDEAWAFLTDPHRVAACLPGAIISEQIDGQTYAGTIALKIGPVSATYKGKITFARLDKDAREIEIVGTGHDVRGKGGAQMHMRSRLSERGPAETEVNVSSEVKLTGVLVQLGQRMIHGVSDQLFQQFTEAMRGELERGAQPAAGKDTGAKASTPQAIDVVGLSAAAGKRALARALRQPLLWIVAAALLAAIYFLFR
jgi:carbon monoxide dehydrogenase subunit G